MPEVPQAEPSARTVRDYARAAWRWKWLIAGVAVACALAAYYYSWRQAPQYRATAALTYQRPVDLTNPLLNSYVDPNVAQLAIESIGIFVASPTVGMRALEILGSPTTHDYTVSTQLNLGSTSGGYSNAAIISVVSTDAAEAADVANAYARAVIEWSKEQQLARVNQSMAALTESLKSYKTPESRQSADYQLLAQRLQNLHILGPTVTSEYQVLVPATVPTKPFAPRPMRSAIVALGGGFLAAMALVLLFDAFSTRLRGRADVTDALGLPIVGVIPEVSKGALSSGRLIAMIDPGAAASEAFRLLRSNLAYVNVDNVSSLLVTSCVAGEGKSTTVCNLAVTLAMAGHRVVVVDCDLRRPRVHEYFGFANDIGLSSVVAGTVQLAEALRPIDLPVPVSRRQGDSDWPPDSSSASTRRRRLAVLTSGPCPPDPGEVVVSTGFAAVLAGLHKSNVEFIIVDSPALLEVGDAVAIAAEVESLLMVVDVDKVGRPALLEAQDLLAPLPCQKLGVVLVRAKSGHGGHARYGYGWA